MKLAIISLISSILLSCSNVRFVSRNEIPIEFTTPKVLKRGVEFEIDRNFYLWGLVPETHTIELDKEVSNHGYKHLKSLEIREINKPVNVWLNILTFGMYEKRVFIIQGELSN